jgi:hypothetical protein
LGVTGPSITDIGFTQTQINSIVPLTNDWGGLPQRIGLRDMTEMYKKDFVSEEGNIVDFVLATHQLGETYAVIKGRLLSEVITDMAQSANIRLNWPVSKILDANGKVQLFGPRDEILTCRKVIVTGNGL